MDSINPPGSALDTIKASPVFSSQLHVYPRAYTYFYGFSHDVPPLDDPLVRGALASAIGSPATPAPRPIHRSRLPGPALPRPDRL